MIKTQPFRSSSLIVTFFTKEFGKIRGVAKGVRREKELRGALFELFTRADIVFYEKTRSDLHLVSEASILESHDKLRTGFASIAYASYFSELVDVVTEVHDPHPKIFELLDFSFRFLPSLVPECLARLFEIKLLEEIGWIPYLKGCVNCQETTFESGFFSVNQGALLCPRCVREFPDSKPLKPSSLAALRFFSHHDLEASIRYVIPQEARPELEGLLQQFMIFRLGKPLKSRQFMQSVKGTLPVH